MKTKELVRSIKWKYHVPSLAALAARIDDSRPKSRYDRDQMLADYIAWERAERESGKGGAA